jgi:protein-S-isoprenylcysteine O-methyltransferase Ste14
MSTQTVQGSESASAPEAPNAKAYDFLAASPLVVWYGIWIVGQAPKLAHDFAGLLLPRSNFLPVIDVFSRLAVFLFAAVLIFLLVVRRPAAAKAPGIFPRVAAFLGAYLGVAILTLPLRPIPWEFKALSTLLILAGMSFALWGLLYLGRSISIMSEARKLVVGGPYRIVRHPLYLGEQLALIGVALQYASPLALVLLALQLRFQLYRMSYEEGILSETFPEYADYMKHTARLVPGVY